jgi:hypothetical protein
MLAHDYSPDAADLKFKIMHVGMHIYYILYSSAGWWCFR